MELKDYKCTLRLTIKSLERIAYDAIKFFAPDDVKDTLLMMFADENYADILAYFTTLYDAEIKRLQEEYSQE